MENKTKTHLQIQSYMKIKILLMMNVKNGHDDFSIADGYSSFQDKRFEKYFLEDVAT